MLHDVGNNRDCDVDHRNNTKDSKTEIRVGSKRSEDEYRKNEGNVIE